MLWTRYLSRRPAAMPVMLLTLIAALLLLSACQPKRPSQAVLKPASAHMQQAFAGTADIQRLMDQARTGGDIHVIIGELDTLTASQSAPIREEALFRKAELMLEGNLPGATEAVKSAINQYPQYALVPYAHFWLARWWLEQEEDGRALTQMSKTLRHPRLTRELFDQVLDLAPALLPEAGEREAVGWLLTAAEVDFAGQENWLRIAARRASMETIEEVMADGSLSKKILPSFALYAGRARLMSGDVLGVGRIAELLAASAPGSHEIHQLQDWASGQVRAATIGVMLPLSGQYARYGEQALRGIRIALAGLTYGEYITLRIEDTASDPATAIQAYRRLANESVNIVIGPLLASTTEALLPYLNPDIPVISMTGSMDLASRSDALFIHTLSPLAQVNVMAQYAWQHEAKRMVVISDGDGSQAEAEMFKASFEALGGEVLQSLELAPNTMDYRDQLRQLRYDTDNGAVQVALLAGQLAYADISDLPIYGSSRWQGGHLLDDRGRYLSHARFAATRNAERKDSDDPQLQHFQFAYREAWGDEKTTALMRLSYDTMRIATVMTSRLGLKKRDVADALQAPEGFPAITGQVHFDASGAGQKQLDIFSIKKGKIVPAG